MRTHLLLIVECLLVPLVLLGCENTSTDPQGDTTAASSHSIGPVMNAVSVTRGRTTVFHFEAKGGSGTAFSFGSQIVSIFVFSGISDTGSNHVVFLNYEVDQCEEEFECTPIESGAGLIPAGDLSIGVKGLKLNTNTSASSNPNFGLGTGAGGPISVEWRRIPGFEFRTSGTTHEKAPGFSQNSQGNSTNFPAVATGSVVGFPINAEDASFGTTHSKIVAQTFSR